MLNSVTLWESLDMMPNGPAGVDVVMNSLPHNDLFYIALDHLLQWVANDVTPPRADRIEIAADGRYFAKDEHGNSIGGVRSVQLDVPHSTYYSNSLDPNGNPLTWLGLTEGASHLSHDASPAARQEMAPEFGDQSAQRTGQIGMGSRPGPHDTHYLESLWHAEALLPDRFHPKLAEDLETKIKVVGENVVHTGIDQGPDFAFVVAVVEVDQDVVRMQPLHGLLEPFLRAEKLNELTPELDGEIGIG